MDKDKLIWTEKGRAWKNRIDEKCDVEIGFAVLFLDGNSFTISVRKTGIGHSSVEGEVVWKNRKGFYQPVSWRGFQYDDAYTYGDLMSGFWEGMIESLRKIVPTGCIMLSVILPERKAWTRDADQYIEYIEQIIHSIDKDIYPVLMPSHQMCSSLFGTENILFVNIEREWTEFVQVENYEMIRNTAIAYGYKTGQERNVPAVIRINDYMNNSTEIWKEERIAGWEAGFQKIWKELESAGWSKGKKVIINCEKNIWKSVCKMIENEEISVEKMSLATMDIQDIAKELVPTVTNKEKEVKKETEIPEVAKNIIKDTRFEKLSLWKL